MMRLAFFYVVVIFYHGFGNVWQSIRTIVNTYDSVITKGGNVLTVKQIVESTDTLAGRVFDLFIQTLIVLSIITFSIETLPDISEQTQYWLRGIEIGTVLIFTVEYIIRFLVSSQKVKYVFSFFGMIDLIAILPFYISTGVDLRSLRAFRLLRLVRLFKLARYNSAVRRLHNALLIAKEELVLFFGLALILLYLSAAGIYYFENEAQPKIFASVIHSLWWSVSTLTTVGYGDVFPVTAGGKLFTAFMLLIGLGVISTATGIVSSALVQARELESQDNTSEDE